MNIIIIGAGGIGQYVARMLSKEQHNIILIDKDPELLEKASWDIDLAIRTGSGSDWQLLDELLELSPDFLIALTNQDEVNFVSCAIAKHLGYPQTIARVSDDHFLNRIRLDFSHIFEVDEFISPEFEVANNILNYIVAPGSLAVEHFAHGAVKLLTLAIPSNWKKNDIPLAKLKMPKGVIVSLIRRELPDRKKEIIFPHGQDILQAGDEVTFMGETDEMMGLHQFLGIPKKKFESVVIAGGSLTGLNLAKLLEKRKIDVRIIDRDFERCKMLSEQLHETVVIQHDATDLDFLRAEKIGSADVFVSCTNHDEINILTSLLGKELGCDEVITVLSNTSLSPLVSEQGISHTISPRVSAADHVLSQVLSRSVTSLISFYENQAEVIELKVSMDSKLLGIPISELGPLLPKDFLIVIIQNRGRIMIAHGDRIISPGDSVIVITNPEHIPELQKIF